MEQYKILRRHFERIGARLKVECSLERPWWDRTDGFRIDVDTDKKGEYFNLEVFAHPGTFQILQVLPKERHLLLMARFDPSLRTEGSEPHGKFLCGHDERHWFVAGVDSKSRNVIDAMQRLKPELVVQSELRRGVKSSHRNLRRNGGFIRQGEWFFVAAPDLHLNEDLILREEPLQRGAGKPHVAAEVYRVGGERVWTCSQYPNGLADTEFYQIYKREPESRRIKWKRMVREPDVYAQGSVRHPDHATIVLKGWHRVLPNEEAVYSLASMNPMAFLD